MEIDRRTFVTTALSAGLAGLAPAVVDAAPAKARHAAVPSWDPDEGVTAPEDLMKEHGVLNRCLLLYEEGLRRLRGREEVSPELFQHTAGLIRRFVESYHEKNEENHIFPDFRRAGKLTHQVETLLRQPNAG